MNRRSFPSHCSLKAGRVKKKDAEDLHPAIHLRRNESSKDLRRNCDEVCSSKLLVCLHDHVLKSDLLVLASDVEDGLLPQVLSHSFGADLEQFHLVVNRVQFVLRDHQQLNDQ